ncbi:deoxyhypusine hydroxylase [Schistocerca cancellata]|uniref:deoxyhypusine hydroxylase n=1 Tax=Schistocerca cancellata TaxID=274614 RepID=UPI0021178BE8|nr:deoxyhypusine hydroxylase [Schistocerca cancellata]
MSLSLIPEERIRAIGSVLNDQERPLKERFRALFTLKNIGGPVAVECIKQCFNDPSALLKHELAYCLGQMQDPIANPILIDILRDRNQEPMVRHEAAEALGAIGSMEVSDILRKYVEDPAVEVAETCQLALARIEWFHKSREPDDQQKSPYASVDPAPPSSENDVPHLKNILLDENSSLFDRYRAMFSLRNINTEESILALCEGLKVGGALFRHEIAFVLGQIQSAVSVPFLEASLKDASENEMVRHECAEALGAIASPECFEILKDYLQDPKRVVKESCEIALDMCEYETSTEFQYADTLLKVH